MSEEQVKQSFLDTVAGDWTRGAACGGISLEWTHRKPGAPTRWARFELHDGLLVAMRLHTDDVLWAPQAEQTGAAVRQDWPYENGRATTIVARGCATHAAEAEQIANAAVLSWLGAAARRFYRIGMR